MDWLKLRGRPDIVWPALPAKADSPWLWSRSTDLLAVAGGGSIAFTLLVIALLPVWPHLGDVVAFALLYLTLLCNGPHYAATYHVVARERALRPGQWFWLLFSAPIVLAALAAALYWPDAVLRPLTRLYLTFSAHHYASQHFGIAAMYSARGGRALEPLEKRALQLGFLGVGAFIMIIVNMTDGPAAAAAYTAAGAAPPGLPPGAYWVALGLAAAGAALYLISEAMLRRRTGRGFDGAVRLLFLTNLVWFVLPNLRVPGSASAWTPPHVWLTLAISFPFFHCLQYLAVVGHRARSTGPIRPIYLLTTLILIGALLFQLPSIGLARFTVVDLVTASALFETVFNLHHYWIDAIIWRRAKPSAARPVAAPA